eukprot:COSAG02_NODE_2545_length_8565_cov_7.011339_7_plen_34_part_00
MCDAIAEPSELIDFIKVLTTPKRPRMDAQPMAS